MACDLFSPRQLADISYATGYSAKWDLFDATQLDALQGQTPVMVGQGNHERDVPNTGVFGLFRDLNRP